MFKVNMGAKTCSYVQNDSIIRPNAKPVLHSQLVHLILWIIITIYTTLEENETDLATDEEILRELPEYEWELEEDEDDE